MLFGIIIPVDGHHGDVTEDVFVDPDSHFSSLQEDHLFCQPEITEDLCKRRETPKDFQNQLLSAFQFASVGFLEKVRPDLGSLQQ